MDARHKATPTMLMSCMQESRSPSLRTGETPFNRLWRLKANTWSCVKKDTHGGMGHIRELGHMICMGHTIYGSHDMVT